MSPLPKTLALTFVFAACGLASADEGMWLPNHPPLTILKDRYDFAPSPQWLEHAQKSAVKFGDGGSASFVSRDGLVLTNHHIGSWALSKLSTPGHDLLKTGFYAGRREQELKCPDTELNVLSSIEDVTPTVTAGETDDMAPAARNDARRKAVLRIEKDSEEKTGLNSSVVTLYGGARYHLYRYRRYTDVRLVFAPEQSVAYFGGDVDNFEYPRFDLDVCLFRVYDPDPSRPNQPLHPEHYLRWGRAGCAEGELLFVYGHPGQTDRLDTLDHLRFIRDVSLPAQLHSLWRREVQLRTFSDRSEENARIAKEEFNTVQNDRKNDTGELAALQDPVLLESKAKDERELRDWVERDPRAKARWGDAWDRVDAALRSYREFHARRRAVNGLLDDSELCSVALKLVRLAAEKPKANADRLPEFGDSQEDSLLLDLYSPAPIEDPIEVDRIASNLSYTAELLGAEDPVVKLALNGKSPRQRAEELVAGTRLKDVAFRRKLAEGGAAAVNSCADPLVRFVAAIDPYDRALRKRYEDEVQAVERENYAKLAAARFALRGENEYPDATNTLRIAFGVVKGYREGDRDVPPFTTIAGQFERWRQRGTPQREDDAFHLPERWTRREKELDPATPMNFVLTADIIGGNSGSPVINRAGEIVGLIFDGNLQSLAAGYVYDERQGRAVAVDCRAIIEALRKVYGGNALADELVGR